MKLFGVLLLAVLICACDSDSHNSNTTTALLSACPDFSISGVPPVVQGAQCGSLKVKENPLDENGVDIAINILRLPSINPEPQPDPLFVIAGGPGQSAVDIAGQIYFAFHEVRKNRDIIFIDQRGTGKSNPLTCSMFEDIEQQQTLSQQQEKLQQAIEKCITQNAEHIPFYTTPYAVQDLDAVRAALNYPQVNLWGVSYGTRVALEYMRRYPERTRTSVLDGVAPVSMALPWHAEQDALDALKLINAQCAEFEPCRTRYGDVVIKAQATADKLFNNPVDVTVTHARTHQSYSLHMTHQTFAFMIRMALYSRDVSRLLPMAIANAHDGNYQLLATLISLTEDQHELMNLSYGMHYTVICNEDYPQYKERNVNASENFLRSNMVDMFKQVCSKWPVADTPREYFSPVTSHVPVLLLSGERDPVTPPHWAEHTQQYLSNARHLVAPGGHHSITRDGCVAQLIAQFINAADHQQIETECVNKILPFSPYVEVHSESSAPDDARLKQEGADKK